MSAIRQRARSRSKSPNAGSNHDLVSHKIFDDTEKSLLQKEVWGATQPLVQKIDLDQCNKATPESANDAGQKQLNSPKFIAAGSNAMPAPDDPL